MDNPVIQTDIAEVLGQINQNLDRIDDRLGKLEVGQAEIKGEIKTIDERLSGQIKAVDEKLSGQIKAVDERLSGQIKALDTKVDQLDKRVGNQEFTNRGVLIGLIVVVLGGAAKFFGMLSNP
ncbi:MAG: hypothetical protein AAGE84_02025 [Cyanobacteria bacterium P01_G01_bin.39]